MWFLDIWLLRMLTGYTRIDIAAYSKNPAVSIILAAPIATWRSIRESSMPCLYIYYFSNDDCGLLLHDSKTCALELRASVALPKGAELLRAYGDNQEVRQDRREMLYFYGFVCHCEMCALPIELSLLHDTKIREARDKFRYLMRFLSGGETDIVRALQTLEDYMFVIVEERLFIHLDLILSLRVFASIHDFESFRMVGAKLLLIVERSFGSDGHGPQGVSVSFVSRMIEDPYSHIQMCGRFRIDADQNTMRRLQNLFRRTALSVLASFQKLL
jgi:hypothetical protein